MSSDIAVVGAGMAGLSCATRLTALGHRVEIFEKSRGVSGRMSTRRTATWECDHGAQYFTARNSDFYAEVSRWEQLGVAARWNPSIRVIGATPRGRSNPGTDSLTTTRFVGTPRMTSPAQHLASTLSVTTNVRVASIRPDQRKWQLLDIEGNALGGPVDVVVFAIPSPQIPTIVTHHPPDWLGELPAIAMLPCWAVMAEVAPTGAPEFDAAFINEGPLSWIANNASKPGRGPAAMWSLHASPEWTQEHLLAPAEEVIPVLTKAFEAHAGLRVLNATAHRWLYSLPKTAHDIPCLWDPRLRLAACGDWLLGGKVQGAWLSGRACAERIAA